MSIVDLISMRMVRQAKWNTNTDMQRSITQTENSSRKPIALQPATYAVLEES